MAAGFKYVVPVLKSPSLNKALFHLSRAIFKYNKVRSKKLPGATLVEALIAMVIISITIGICAYIYIRATDHTNQSAILTAVQLCESIKKEALETKKYVDDEITLNGFEALKTFSKPEEGLIGLKVKVILSGKEVYMANYLFRE